MIVGNGYLGKRLTSPTIYILFHGSNKQTKSFFLDQRRETFSSLGNTLFDKNVAQLPCFLICKTHEPKEGFSVGTKL